MGINVFVFFFVIGVNWFYIVEFDYFVVFDDFFGGMILF